MKIENLVEFVRYLKIKAGELRNQAADSLRIGNKQAAESYLNYSKIFNTAANNLKEVYLKAYDSIIG